MVQQEVKKKTGAYGLIGLLLAIMLVAMIYSYGVTPGTSPSPLPFVSSTPNASPNASPNTGPEANVAPMKTFASYDELKNFLNATNPAGNGYYGLTNDARTEGLPAQAPMPIPTTAPTSTSAKDYSTTNIQVAGVDEADTVKTDGKYLYVIGDNGQTVYILDANPQSAKVLSKISFSNAYLSGVYLSENGNKLAIIGNQYEQYYVDSKMTGDFYSGIAMPYWNSGTNFVQVYDVSTKDKPTLARNFTMSGNYVNSRLIGDYIYDIVSQSAYEVNGTVVLPTVFLGRETYSVEPSKIYYANTSDTYYSYTTLIALNIMNDAASPTNLTIMMGNTGAIYVSQTNIYVTYPVWNYETVTQPASASTPVEANKDVGISIMPIMIRPSWQGTAIYRIHVFGDSMTFSAQGNVTGTILSQYSMDEFNGNFRIATTSYDYSLDSWWSGTQQNNLYVLNSDLKLVGKIEDLATGESLHAARFMGNRCYLVTFLQVDPLFVIDLSAPSNPVVLGNLTIPGYSDFLQPYDETHLIGIGQEVDASIDADLVHTPGAVYYTAILGLKVSLFDVSDVANPKEVSKYVIGDRGTTSAALNDPKALLFDASRKLLVLPVDLYLFSNRTATTDNKTAMPTAVPPARDSWATEYPQFVWQGAYVFNIDLSSGLTLRGNITQMDNAQALLADPSLAAISSYPWIDSNHFITRSMYIGNALYTFSASRVQINSLDLLSLLAKIELK